MARGRKPSYILKDDSIVENIYAAQALKEQTRCFFHFSPLWRAIENHIADQRAHKRMDHQDGHKVENVVLIDPPLDWKEEEDSYLGVKCYRGSGYAVSFHGAIIYGFKDEAKNVDVKIEVEWETNDGSWAEPESFTKSYTIKVPVSLCNEFSEEAFASWVNDVRSKRDQEKRKEDAKTFRRLVNQYPTMSHHVCQQMLAKIEKDGD